MPFLGEKRVKKHLGCCERTNLLEAERLAVVLPLWRDVSVDEFLDAAHHDVRPLPGRLHARLHVKHRERHVAQRVVAENQNSINKSFLFKNEFAPLESVGDFTVALQADVVSVKHEVFQLGVDLQRLGQQPRASVSHHVTTEDTIQALLLIFLISNLMTVCRHFSNQPFYLI